MAGKLSFCMCCLYEVQIELEVRCGAVYFCKPFLASEGSVYERTEEEATHGAERAASLHCISLQHAL